MEPVFTVQWPEFVVAERLRKLLPARNGYSVLIPLSRQEKGIDLAVLRAMKSDQSFVITIQVKASRTYLPPQPKLETTIRYKYYTWFKRFDVPDRADFVILFGMYAPDLGRTRRVSSTWYRDCSLLFTKEEMCNFIANCKTIKGKPDRMFGFGFNDLSSIILTRGDMSRSQKDFSKYLLDKRINEIKRRLKG
ncbi:MAG: hypothetical protein A2Y97_12275 [Nitrospirae bacterium RBG_13_39_12]|nr:MAG: hypothetical protein A2Y97_12275 [Nitrospirae bacterium RBG_13_39_12]